MSLRSVLYLCLYFICQASLFATHNITFLYFSPLANQGHPHARLVLGRMYREGRGGIAQSHELALLSFQTAYNGAKGSLDRTWIEAAVELGRLYQEGLGVEQNLTVAYNYFNEAAEQWSARAMYFIGNIHEQGGSGFPVDYSLAVDWYLKAIKNGSSFAKQKLEDMLNNGFVPYNKLSIASEPFNRDERIANHMNPGAVNPALSKLNKTKIITSAEKTTPVYNPENAYDQILLGRRYELGDKTEKNMAEAIKWYEKAANSDHPLAQEILGNIYAEGRSPVATNPISALKWFYIAASNPNAGDNSAFYAKKAAELEQGLPYHERKAALDKKQAWESQKR